MKIKELTGEQKFDRYIMIAPGSDYGRAMWNDIADVENAILLPSAVDSKSGIVNWLHHAHFSFLINEKMTLPFQGIWKNHYTLSKLKLPDSEKCCIIYTDVSACRTDIKYLKMLSKKSNVVLNLILVNLVSSKEKMLKQRFPYFQHILSFDKRDCERNGFLYYPTNYSVLDIEMEGEKKDVFFVGNAKGRGRIINRMAELFADAGIEIDFYLNGVSGRDCNNSAIVYNKWINYEDVLKKVNNCNCIVEVVAKEQEGLTLRTMEAICYNKKLLTNNIHVKELPFYNPDYIQVFEDVKDIDTAFVKDRTIVDYGYKDEFSPIHLLEYLNKL